MRLEVVITFHNWILFFFLDTPLLTILNSTAIEAQWNRSSIFEPHVAITYTLVVVNDTTKMDILSKSFHIAAESNIYSMNYILSMEDTAFYECHIINFTILASSSDGKEERPASATSGFPIGEVSGSLLINYFSYLC